MTYDLILMGILLLVVASFVILMKLLRQSKTRTKKPFTTEQKLFISDAFGLLKSKILKELYDYEKENFSFFKTVSKTMIETFETNNKENFKSLVEDVYSLIIFLQYFFRNKKLNEYYNSPEWRELIKKVNTFTKKYEETFNLIDTNSIVSDMIKQNMITKK